MPVATSETSETKEISVMTSANLHIVNDPSIAASDGVSLSFELFVRLFPNTQKDAPIDSNKFVLIKLIGVPDYFDRAKIYRVTSIDDLVPSASSVTFINQANLAKFGRNLTVRGCTIQSISRKMIPTLKNVIVEVPINMYDVLSGSLAASVKDHFISKYIAGNGGVVSLGDTISLINGDVVLCEPFYQGFVDLATDLTFVKKATEVETDFQMVETDDQEMDLSQFLYKSVLVDPEESNMDDYLMDIAPLPHRMSLHSTAFATEDSELYVFMSTADVSRLGFPIFNGDLAILTAGDSTIVVKIVTFLEPNTFAPKTAYLSPLLLVNLKVKADTKVVFKQFSTSSQHFAGVFPIAKAATISRIVSPITMDKTYQQSFLAELKSTFHLRSKCFRQGDVFPVCIDSVLAKALFEVSLQHQNGQNEEDSTNEMPITPTGNPDSVAWFKILEVSGSDGESSPFNQYRIDPSQTALTSTGIEFIPTPKNQSTNWSDYLDLPSIFDYSTVDAVPALFAYAKEFKRVIKTGMETSSKIDLKTTVLLNSMSRGLGKTNVVRSLALELGLNLIELDAFDFIKPGAELKTIGLLSGKIEKQLNGQSDASTVTSYNLLYIKHIENLCVQADPNEQGANTSTSLSLKVVDTIMGFLNKYKNMALVASCNDIDKLSDSFRQMIKFQIDASVPSEQERLEIFRFLLQIETNQSNTESVPEAYDDKIQFIGRQDLSKYRIDTRADISPQSLALQSAGLTPRDLMAIIRKAKQLGIKRLRELAKSQSIPLDQLLVVGNGGVVQLIPEDFDKAINDARNQFSDSIGAPRIPNVKWEDIGGLDLVKDEILDTIDMPLKHPELFSNGLKKRSGILFYGPPGTGKTLLAKAIATNFSLNFFSVKGPELLNMYIGESEANVRRVFQRARDAKPCVIFFDELDSVAPKRGNQGDSGGVMDRIVSQLLAELDGMSDGESNGEGVFVVGATNRPDLLDEALLRPGRFDKMLYLGISDTNEKQTKILEALTRKFKLSDDVDLVKIAEKCSFTFTGADFYALCSDSMLNAMTRAARAVDVKLKAFNEKRVANGEEEVSSRWWFDNVAQPEDINVEVTMQDFRKAQNELLPSVSADELAHYLRVKENFEGGNKKPQPSEKDGNNLQEIDGYNNNDFPELNGYQEDVADQDQWSNGTHIMINADE